MSNSVKPDELATKVMQMLNTYNDEISEGIENVAEEVAAEGKDELRNTSQPSVGQGKYPANAKPMSRRQWSNYVKGWTNQTTSKKAKGYFKKTIFNKDHYQLTHLLEYGHATRNGKYTRAFPHIKPVEEKLNKEYEEKVKEIIKKGGK